MSYVHTSGGLKRIAKVQKKTDIVNFFFFPTGSYASNTPVPSYISTLCVVKYFLSIDSQYPVVRFAESVFPMFWEPFFMKYK